MASRAASATTSAHETTPGHTASSTAFAVSITSNPPSDAFGAASFSAAAAAFFVVPGVESSSTDASHPCYLAGRTPAGRPAMSVFMHSIELASYRRSWSIS